MSTLFLCGAGNPLGVRLALRVAALEGHWTRVVVLDDDPARHGDRLVGVPVVGGFECLAGADPTGDRVVNLVARTTAGRERARARIATFGVPFTALVSPDVDTLGAALADDVTVYPNATIGPGSRVGRGCVVFMGAVVGHGAHVGDGSVVAANAVLNARVTVGEAVYVGTNATVLPELHIGRRATVGAGSSVVADVPEGATVLGVPARPVGPAMSPTPPDVELPATASQGHDRLSPAEVEVRLAPLWRTLLGVSSPSPTRSFFDLGGTSLGALQLAAAVQEEFGVPLDPVTLFRFPTIRALAGHLAAPRGARRPPTPAPAPGPGEPAREPDGEVPDSARLVQDVFAALLHGTAPGIDDDFFAAGGTDADAHVACAALERATGRALCHMHVARFPTPRALASFIDDGATTGAPVCPAGAIVRRMVHHERRRA